MKRVFALLAIAASMSVFAGPKEDAILAKMKEITKSPGISVQATPFPDLFEVHLGGGNIVYTNPTVDYVMLGNLIDPSTQKNLTDERRSELNKVDFKSLPLERAIKTVKGNGQAKIAVFEDPNCGFCKRLHSELKKVDNVTVYTFLMPVLGADSVSKARGIWCAPNRAKAWSDIMSGGPIPDSNSSCDSSVVDKNLELGNTLGIQGTPTIFLADGRRLPGFVTAEELKKNIASTK